MERDSNFVLDVVHGYTPTGPVVLSLPFTVMGRASTADIQVPVRAVSSRHAEITQTGGGFFIRDLDSRNGTYVDGRRINDDRVPLRAGSSIVLGNGAVEFRVRFGGTLPQAWLRIDRSRKDVWLDGRRLTLPPLQYALLEALDQAQGDWVAKDCLIVVVWPDGASDDQLTTLVHRVRRAVDPSGEKNPVDNDRRRGYRLNARGSGS